MGSFRSFTGNVAFALAFVWAARAAAAEEPEPSREDRLEALEQKIRIIERQRELEKEEGAVSYTHLTLPTNREV